MSPGVKQRFEQLVELPLETETELHARVADVLGELRDLLGPELAGRALLRRSRVLGSAIFGLLQVMHELGEPELRAIQATARVMVERCSGVRQDQLAQALADAESVVNSVSLRLGFPHFVIPALATPTESSTD